MKVLYDDAYIPISNEYMTRRVLANQENLMLVHMTFHKKNDDPGMHSHPHEQIAYIEKGQFEFIQEDGQRFILKAGDSVYFPPNMKHGAIVLEDDSRLLDIFTPTREDFLPR